MHQAFGPKPSYVRQRAGFLFAFLIGFALLFLPNAVAQKSGGGIGPGGGSSSSSTSPKMPAPPRDISPNAAPSSVILNGRVASEDGTVIPETIVVEQVCGTSVRARTRTDVRGNFNLTLGFGSSTELLASPESSDNGRMAQERRPRMGGCELRAVLAGYVSSHIPLSGTESEFGMKSVGTILLRKINGRSAGGGGAVSVTSFQIPDKARKEFEKAVKLAQKNKPKEAEEHLLKAVDVYPKYATAWVALGQVLESEKPDDAKAAYRHAMDSDPNYVPPYLHLALFAVRERNWTEAVRLTDQALRLNATDYADAHFINAVAKLNLNQIEGAREEALKAADIDREHRQPRIQYLLAAICEARGERDMAATHLREYLKFAPQAPDAAAVRAHLSELDKNTSAER